MERSTNMFGYKSLHEQLIEERNKNEQLQYQLEKANADLYYIAMMADVNLEEDSEVPENDEI